MKIIKNINGAYYQTLTDCYYNNIGEGDIVVYAPLGRYTHPRILKVVRVKYEGDCYLAVNVNNQYYTGSFMNQCIVIQKSDGSLVNTNLNFDEKGHIV